MENTRRAEIRAEGMASLSEARRTLNKIAQLQGGSLITSRSAAAPPPERRRTRTGEIRPGRQAGNHR